MALATITEQNPDDQIKVTQGTTLGGITALEITDKYTREECSTSPSLLHRYQSVAEAWGARAWVEWDPDRKELVVIIG